MTQDPHEGTSAAVPAAFAKPTDEPPTAVDVGPPPFPGAGPSQAAPTGPSAPVRLQSQHARDKGIACRLFVETGSCNVAKCPYAHFTTETRRPVPQSTCTYYLKYRCLRDDCPFLHLPPERLDELKAAGALDYWPLEGMPIRDPLLPLSAEAPLLPAAEITGARPADVDRAVAETMQRMAVAACPVPKERLGSHSQRPTKPSVPEHRRPPSTQQQQRQMPLPVQHHAMPNVTVGQRVAPPAAAVPATATYTPHLYPQALAISSSHQGSAQHTLADFGRVPVAQFSGYPVSNASGHFIVTYDRPTQTASQFLNPLYPTHPGQQQLPSAHPPLHLHSAQPPLPSAPSTYYLLQPPPPSLLDPSRALPLPQAPPQIFFNTQSFSTQVVCNTNHMQDLTNVAAVSSFSVAGPQVLSPPSIPQHLLHPQHHHHWSL